MNPNHIAAFRAIEEAQKALRAHDKPTARRFAVQATQLAPELEEAWLMLAALATPRASVAYLEKALEINPKSERAHKGMAWAVKRLREQQAKQPAKLARPSIAPVPVPIPAQVPAPIVAESHPQAAAPRRVISYSTVLVILLCLAAVFVIWQGATPALAMLNNSPFAQSQGGVAWAEVQLEKPTYTLTPTATFTPTITPTPTATDTPTATPTDTPTATPTDTPSLTPTETPVPSETPIPSATVPYVAPTNTPYVAPTAQTRTGERWVEINLSQQMLYAWEGETLVGSFVVSTGTWQTPTVTGTYRVYARFKYKDMSGPGYYLPDVPNTMFFYQGYAIHGTYWHNNFGTPMSHGCVNMTIPESEWLFNWAPSNLLVDVHY
jgi:lipoprotein-anchoring transpeptidase ErfK/SrfK